MSDGAPRVSRRILVSTAAGAGGALLLAAGCDGAYESLARRLGSGIPGSFAVPAGDDVDPDFHFLARATYGVHPGDLDGVRSLGRDSWLEEQLHPDRIDDQACTLLARRYGSLHERPGNLFDYSRRTVREEVVRATVIRAVHSRRQLHEVMVGFWTDHLSIDHNKGDCAWLKTADDRDVIRRHALGSFRELIRASATSQAMLVYLDGARNKRAAPGEKPNENYARELLELHTLGVHGGYSQEDVMEAARCLTGWTVRGRGRWKRALVEFDLGRHDDGPKRVLGVELPAGLGAGDTDRLVDIVCGHPSTAQHIATKLCQRFTSPEPPPALVERVAATFRETDGDIRSTLRTLLTSEEHGAGAVRGRLLKRPFRFLVSALRGLGVTTASPRSLVEYLRRMGHMPFAYPTPDGYPIEPAPWLGNFLWRWQLAMALVGGRVAGVTAPIDELLAGSGCEDPLQLFPHLIGRQPTPAETDALLAFQSTASGDGARPESLGLLLASPAFQVY